MDLFLVEAAAAVTVEDVEEDSVAEETEVSRSSDGSRGCWRVLERTLARPRGRTSYICCAAGVAELGDVVESWS